jgi:hypothetical protein
MGKDMRLLAKKEARRTSLRIISKSLTELVFLEMSWLHNFNFVRILCL